jgi:hypothetical protein
MNRTGSNRARTISLGEVLGAGFRALHPSFARVLLQDLAGISSQRTASSRRHLDATMRWLCRAQDHGGGRGVSAGYSLKEGWLPPYPETTGYIIPTFYDYGHFSGRAEFAARALRMADWEIEVQLPTGAVQAGTYRAGDAVRRAAVFNTGQVILGWCRTFGETKAQRFLEAARRAGDWLVGVQSSDGAWRIESSETETDVHTYDVRTAWSLLELHRLTGQSCYREAARRNLDWALGQQAENGWFEHNAFFVSGDKWNLPFTHTIAYVMEGFQEASRLLGEERYLRAVQKAAERLLRILELRRYMAGEFDQAWKSTAKFSCLTGDAQIAGVWLRLFDQSRDPRFLNAALKLNDFVKATQSLRAWHPGVRGGLKGSHPIQGRYTPFIFVNWGAKFLADSLMLEERLLHEFEREVLGESRAAAGPQ